MAALREVFARFSTQFQTTQLERGEAQIERVTASLGRLGLALGAGAVLAGTKTLVDSVVHSSVELSRQAQRLGVSTQAMEELGFAASASGRDMEDMVDAMSTLQERARDALVDPKSDPAEQLRLLGVSATDSAGNLKNAETLIGEVADGLAGMGNQTDRVGAAMTLFGDVGRELLPTLQQGSSGINNMREEFRALGGGISEEAIEASEEFTRQQIKLDATLTSLRSTIGLFIIPILTRLTETLSNFLADTEKVEAMKVVLGALATVITVQLAPALLVLTQRLVAFLVPWAPVIAAAALLYLVFEDLFTAMNGGKSLFNDLTEALEGFFEANRNGTGVLGTVSRTWERMVRLMERGFAIVNAITSGDSSILENFDASQRPGARRRGGGSVGILADGTTTTIPRRAAGTAAGGSEVTQNNNTTINTGADQAAVERALERTNRRAVENLEQRVAR